VGPVAALDFGDSYFLPPTFSRLNMPTYKSELDRIHHTKLIERRESALKIFREEFDKALRSSYNSAFPLTVYIHSEHVECEIVRAVKEFGGELSMQLKAEYPDFVFVEIGENLRPHTNAVAAVTIEAKKD